MPPKPRTKRQSQGRPKLSASEKVKRKNLAKQPFSGSEDPGWKPRGDLQLAKRSGRIRRTPARFIDDDGVSTGSAMEPKSELVDVPEEILEEQEEDQSPSLLRSPSPKRLRISKEDEESCQPAGVEKEQKAATGYKVFMATVRRKKTKGNPNVKFEDIVSEASELWNDLDDDVKANYEKKAQEINSRREVEAQQQNIIKQIEAADPSSPIPQVDNETTVKIVSMTGDGQYIVETADMGDSTVQEEAIALDASAILPDDNNETYDGSSILDMAGGSDQCMTYIITVNENGETTVLNTMTFDEREKELDALSSMDTSGQVKLVFNAGEDEDAAYSGNEETYLDPNTGDQVVSPPPAPAPNQMPVEAETKSIFSVELESDDPELICGRDIFMYERACVLLTDNETINFELLLSGVNTSWGAMKRNLKLVYVKRAERQEEMVKNEDPTAFKSLKEFKTMGKNLFWRKQLDEGTADENVVQKAWEELPQSERQNWRFKAVVGKKRKLLRFRGKNAIQSGFDLFCKEMIDGASNDDEVDMETLIAGYQLQWNGLDVSDQRDYEERAKVYSKDFIDATLDAYDDAEWPGGAKGDLAVGVKTIPKIEFKRDENCPSFSECQFTFRDLFSLREHLDATPDHPEPDKQKYKCPACSKMIPTLALIRSHLEDHLSAQLSCSQCLTEFTSMTDLQQHLKTNHALNCRFCDSTNFITKGNLRRHVLRVHVHQEIRDCEYCSAMFIDPEKHNNHVIRNHYSDIGLLVSDPVVRSKLSNKEKINYKLERRKYSKPAMETTLFCNDCNVHFDTIPKLKYHRLKFHGKWQEGAKCELCDKVYGSKSNLHRHQRDAHQVGPLAKVDEKGQLQLTNRKKCPDCGFQTRDAFHLRVHMRKHTGERPFKCDKCTFGFMKNSDLTHHMKKCKGIKYQCEKCNQIFHFKKQLLDHKVWDVVCGTVKNKAGTAPLPVPEQNQRYLQEKPSIVRLNISRDTSVVGVNCESMIDKNMFFRKKKKARCGICSGCERATDCGECKGCIPKDGDAPPKGQQKRCVQRQCLNLVYHYDVRKDKKKELLSRAGPDGEATLFENIAQLDEKPRGPTSGVMKRRVGGRKSAPDEENGEEVVVEGIVFDEHSEMESAVLHIPDDPEHQYVEYVQGGEELLQMEGGAQAVVEIAHVEVEGKPEQIVTYTTEVPQQQAAAENLMLMAEAAGSDMVVLTEEIVESAGTTVMQWGGKLL